MWIQQNPNPLGQHVGDCVIRALSIVLDQSWVKTYLEVCIQGLLLANMPSCNNVWGAYLRSKGFKRAVIPDTCPDCYSIRDFCKDNPSGIFVLGTGNHAVAVVDGNYIDDWDSGDEVPIFVWRKNNASV